MLCVLCTSRHTTTPASTSTTSAVTTITRRVSAVPASLPWRSAAMLVTARITTTPMNATISGMPGTITARASSAAPTPSTRLVRLRPVELFPARKLPSTQSSSAYPRSAFTSPTTAWGFLTDAAVEVSVAAACETVRVKVSDPRSASWVMVCRPIAAALPSSRLLRSAAVSGPPSAPPPRSAVRAGSAHSESLGDGVRLGRSRPWPARRARTAAARC